MTEFSFVSEYHGPHLDHNACRPEQNVALRRTPMAALHNFSHVQLSHLTEHNGEVHVNTGMVQLHNALWDQIFLDSLQLGLFSAIFCHHCLLIEFMGKVPVLVIV